MSKQSAELARIRQTCCLGLPSEVIIAQIIDELRRLIPWERMHMAWTDELGNVINSFFEKPDTTALDYLQNHARQIEEDTGVSMRAAILFGKLTGNFRWPYRQGFEQTESYRRF